MWGPCIPLDVVDVNVPSNKLKKWIMISLEPFRTGTYFINVYMYDLLSIKLEFKLLYNYIYLFSYFKIAQKTTSEERLYICIWPKTTLFSFSKFSIAKKSPFGRPLLSHSLGGL